MTHRYVCSGRTFPNGPSNSRVGCDRRSPRTVQVAYGHATGPYHFHEFEYLNIHWSGNPTTGHNVRCNWNLDLADYPGSGLDINVNVQSVLGGLGGFTLQVDFRGGFPVVHQVYQHGPVDWIHWEDFLDGQNLDFIGLGSPGPWILEEQVVLRLGTYERLPPDTCLV